LDAELALAGPAKIVDYVNSLLCLVSLKVR
jgi:hypothetical protein